MSSVPVIRLEFESMRQSLKMMVADHMLKIDTDIQEAIDRYCTPENLQYLIDQEVRQSVNAAVKDEIQNLFRYSGPGRLAIKEAIKSFADEHWSERNHE